MIAHFAEAVRPPPAPTARRNAYGASCRELLARRRQLVVMINAERQRFAKARNQIDPGAP